MFPIRFLIPVRHLALVGLAILPLVLAPLSGADSTLSETIRRFSDSGR